MLEDGEGRGFGLAQGFLQSGTTCASTAILQYGGKKAPIEMIRMDHDTYAEFPAGFWDDLRIRERA